MTMRGEGKILLLSGELVADILYCRAVQLEARWLHLAPKGLTSGPWAPSAGVAPQAWYSRGGATMWQGGEGATWGGVVYMVPGHWHNMVGRCAPGTQHEDPGTYN